MPPPYATLPEPPYYAVIFAARLRDPGAELDADPDADRGYHEPAARMTELAAEQPGFLGVETARDPDGFGITVSYWRDEASIAAWKAHAEHALTRERGRALWYGGYTLRVARVERAYGFGEALA